MRETSGLYCRGEKRRKDKKKAQYPRHGVVSGSLRHFESTVRDLIDGIQIERSGTTDSSKVSSRGRVCLLRLLLDRLSPVYLLLYRPACPWTTSRAAFVDFHCCGELLVGGLEVFDETLVGELVIVILDSKVSQR